ncbi:Thivi_2564 family membrane protein [Marispirochaeta aestuarii]|uniref:Thivi_2564 family membrane protein n=2 Tax=Marispirochaeta aestuarii TaxID=1963862 RepID=UPI003748DC60
MFKLSYKQEEENMPLLELLIILVALGGFLWLINTYIPMQTNIKNILNVVVLIVAILFVLNAFGILGSTWRFRINRW